MLLAHLVLSLVPETLCSRTQEVKEENVVEHQHAWTVNGSCSADLRIPTAKKETLVGTRNTRPQSNVFWKNVGFRMSVSYVACTGAQDGHFWTFSSIVRRSLTFYVPCIVTNYINKPTGRTFFMYLSHNFCTTMCFERPFRSSSGVHDLLYLQLYKACRRGSRHGCMILKRYSFVVWGCRDAIMLFYLNTGT